MVTSPGHDRPTYDGHRGEHEPVAASVAAVQETQFTAGEPADGQGSQDDRIDGARGRQSKRQSYGSVQNGYPSSPPSFSPATSGTLARPNTAPTKDNVPATTGSARILAPDLLRGLLMVLQSIDHSALMLGAWRHGVAKETEGDAMPMHEWNSTRAYIARTLTHFCAPGFMFLLGMGTVYFTRSRSKLGWTSYQLLRHYFVRMAALFLVNESLLPLLSGGIGTMPYVFNIVLVALAVNYFISGLLCLLMRSTEPALAALLSGSSLQSQTFSSNRCDEETAAPPDESAPLLSSDPSTCSSPVSPTAVNLSWHFHNALLLALTAVTISWNIWLSPHGGRCLLEKGVEPSPTVEEMLLSGYHNGSGEDLVHAMVIPPPTKTSKHGAFFDFWFYPVVNANVISVFPPLAWSSFAVFGVLYARVVLARKWKPLTIVKGNLLVAVLLAVLFVLTRLLHFGNLSEGCLHLPEQESHPEKNQFLVSLRSFFYVVKYPPSVAFFSMTLSANFFLLAGFGALPSNLAVKIPGLMNFGSSALFFYVMHFVVFRLLAIPARAAFAHRLPDNDPQTGAPAYGLGDTAAYWSFWVVGLVILNPLCRIYGRFKSRQPPDSLWRFF